MLLASAWHAILVFCACVPCTGVPHQLVSVSILIMTQAEVELTTQNEREVLTLVARHTVVAGTMGSPKELIALANTGVITSRMICSDTNFFIFIFFLFFVFLFFLFF